MLTHIALALTVISFSSFVSAQEAKAPIQHSNCKINSSTPLYQDPAYLAAIKQINHNLEAKGYEVRMLDEAARAKRSSKFCAGSYFNLVLGSHNSSLDETNFQGISSAMLQKVSFKLSTKINKDSFLCEPSIKTIDQVTLNFAIPYGIDQSESDIRFFEKMIEAVNELPNCEKK